MRTATRAVTVSVGDQRFTLGAPAAQTCTANSGTHAGKPKLETVYEPSATARRLPAALRLSLPGLKPGAHTLTVMLTYKQSRVSHRHNITITDNETLRDTFTVC